MSSLRASLAQWFERLPATDPDDATSIITDLCQRFETCDNDLPVETTEPGLAIALSAATGAGWRLLVPVDPPVGVGIERQGRVLAVHDTGELDFTTWAEIGDDGDYWLGQGAAIVGADPDDIEALPFWFDGDSWEGTQYDEAYGEGDWEIEIGGYATHIDLHAVVLRYATAHHGPAAGTYLEIAEGGTSMTTGDIGQTLTVDENGAAWRYLWGSTDRYIGRVEPDFSPIDTFELDALSGVCAISSDVLGAGAMRDVLEWVEGLDVNFSLDAITISCPGFTGSATELLALDEDT